MKRNINGVIVEVVTIAKLAELCGKQPASLRKYMKRNILPEANIRDGGNDYRLYSLECANKIAAVFHEFKAGVSVTEVQKQAIREALMDERKTLKI